jgi:hypothetical protein
MTFRELVVGDHFVMLGSHGRHVQVKRGERFYFDLVTGTRGVVGVGDNPVRRVACARHVPASQSCGACLSEIEHEERES